MTYFLLRADGCPLQEDKLSFELTSWLSVLGDTINSTFDIIEANMNLLVLQPMTQTQITDAFTDGLLIDGTVIYDSTNNVYVGQQSGALVKFTTTSYP